MSLNSINTSGNPELLAIVGPTASGKTSLSLRLAQLLDGEILCVDSRTIYKYLDIGTAKPTLAEQQQISHWGIDLIGPENPNYTVADFQTYAKRTISDIQARGKIPILVGGSGLYMDAVLYNFSLAPSKPQLRQQLEQLSIAELQEQIRQQNLSMPENSLNKRYLIRTLERGNEHIGKQPLPQHWQVVGIDPPTDILRDRIASRFDHMLDQGLLKEVQAIVRLYGPEVNAANTGVYKVMRQYIAGHCSLEQAKTTFLVSDWHLAKQQRTWFHRHDADITWFQDIEQAYAWIAARKPVH